MKRIEEIGPFTVYHKKNSNQRNIIIQLDKPIELLKQEVLDISWSWFVPHIKIKYPEYHYTFISFNQSKKNHQNIKQFFLEKDNYTFIVLGGSRYEDFLRNEYLSVKQAKEKNIQHAKHNNKLINAYWNKIFSFLGNKIYSKILYIEDTNIMLHHREKMVEIKDEYKEILSTDEGFFDYIGNDQKVIKHIKDLFHPFAKRLEENKIFSPLGFMAKNRYYTFSFINYSQYYPDVFQEHQIFMSDVNNLHPFFEYIKAKYKTFYLVDDKRGTRNFNFLPIPELHHLIYGKHYAKKHRIKIKKLKDKNPLIEFHGNVFNTNRFGKIRENYYPKYFRETSHVLKEKFIMYFKYPDRNHHLFKEVAENLYCCGNFKYPEKINKLKDFKYTLCTRPHSFNESISYRIQQALFLEQLPLIEEGFDPDNLLDLDPDIKGNLSFSCDKDIIDLYHKFENNPELAQEYFDYLFQWSKKRIEKYKKMDY